MSGPTLHALAMIALLGATAAVCVLYGRPEKGPRLLFSGLVALLCVLAYPIFGMHKCDSGQPGTQAIVGGACAVALAVWVRRLIPAHLLTLAALACTAGLVEHYNALVHTADVTGNPAFSREHIERDFNRIAADALAELAKSDKASYAAGWLKDEPFVPKGNAGLDLTRVLPRWRTESWWHSSLTGLYGKRSHDVALWFPGGTLTEGASGLEWRDLNPVRRD